MSHFDDLLREAFTAGVKADMLPSEQVNLDEVWVDVQFRAWHHLKFPMPREDVGGQDREAKVPCRECGPGYNIGDEGCSHRASTIPAGSGAVVAVSDEQATFGTGVETIPRSKSPVCLCDEESRHPECPEHGIDTITKKTRSQG